MVRCLRTTCRQFLPETCLTRPLRRILVHMIQETARHNGHADFMREFTDGQTGE
ncbi:MAG: DUF664 domain-containing protein [Chloroflexi bacterium]|nr:DUF664 domain-containing protein [Chloroflexota bacterium]